MLAIWLIYFMPPFSWVMFGVRVVCAGLLPLVFIVLRRFSDLGRTELFLRGLGYAYLADLAGLSVFAAICIWNIAVYDSRYPLICMVAFCLAVFLLYFLHCRFGFKYCELSKKKRHLISALMTVVSAPWFFFIPQ